MITPDQDSLVDLHLSMTNKEWAEAIARSGFDNSVVYRWKLKQMKARPHNLQAFLDAAGAVVSERVCTK